MIVALPSGWRIAHDVRCRGEQLNAWGVDEHSVMANERHLDVPCRGSDPPVGFVRLLR